MLFYLWGWEDVVWKDRKCLIRIWILPSREKYIESDPTLYVQAVRRKPSKTVLSVIPLDKRSLSLLTCEDERVLSGRTGGVNDVRLVAHHQLRRTIWPINQSLSWLSLSFHQYFKICAHASKIMQFYREKLVYKIFFNFLLVFSCFQFESIAPLLWTVIPFFHILREAATKFLF